MTFPQVKLFKLKRCLLSSKTLKCRCSVTWLNYHNYQFLIRIVANFLLHVVLVIMQYPTASSQTAMSASASIRRPMPFNAAPMPRGKCMMEYLIITQIYFLVHLLRAFRIRCKHLKAVQQQSHQQHLSQTQNSLNQRAC